MTKTPARAIAEPAILWFRDDLRLADNPALREAHASGAPLLCVYVFDEETAGMRKPGGASRWWLHHSLAALGQDIAARGGRLDLFRGAAETILPALAQKSRAGAVFWTRRYGGAEIAADANIKAALTAAGARAASFKGQLLHEPWELEKKSGGGFEVYSPYWRAARAMPEPAAPLPSPKDISCAPCPSGGPDRIDLADLALLPTRPDWASGLRETWTPGERGAQARLTAFLANGLENYAAARDDLGAAATSHLSPHLRFGEISPRQILAGVRWAEQETPGSARGAEKFLAEIGWREFDYHLLFRHPGAAETNINPRFDAMPWRSPSKTALRAWRLGRTGYPVVDAGMRELWTTGYMHNRVRMVAASFLVKHLLVDWRIGEKWFWDTLCDADPANNPMNWQWVAGSGADAAPYFRVFNPVLQGEKFDSSGVYVRRHVPELAAMPDRWIHKPWLAPTDVLRKAGVTLGKTYPAPIVDHAKARADALAAFEAIKG
ncbi:cryptochrome/photolyase family protein [Methylocapsa palsarum]|uniref:Deoxyribodipyrimidine photo-lyase n=1 Tax=Methylocapsa palsarum TaxID=1612308 RepID=A0A1I3X0X7_9HYPH|nr:deoxyribodipyrimidine photo-lyase [Methylocapsa palsarum]SFK13009.1 deoxyribodipyrimidine photo-lyase [Methylocapsa palsarum]